MEKTIPVLPLAPEYRITSAIYARLTVQGLMGAMTHKITTEAC